MYIKTMSRDVYILKNDILILREFAKQYMQIANDPIQESRRKLWHAHNSFDSARPLIQVSPFPFVLNIVENDLQCEDELYRGYEWELRKTIYNSSFWDDTIVSHGLPYML